jgi:hypothetical protein
MEIIIPWEDGNHDSGSYDANNNPGSMGDGDGGNINVIKAPGTQIRNQTFPS